MIERRKATRDSVKATQLNANKIARIMFIKSIILPMIVLIVGIVYISYIAISGYLDTKKLTDQIDDFKQKTEVIKTELNKLQSENTKLESRLIRIDPKGINIQEVESLAQKAVNLLQLKNLISSYSINVSRVYEYRNVAKIHIDVTVESTYIDEHVLENIFLLVFDQIFHIKNMQVSYNSVDIEVYKKVERK